MKIVFLTILCLVTSGLAYKLHHKNNLKVNHKLTEVESETPSNLETPVIRKSGQDLPSSSMISPTQVNSLGVGPRYDVSRRVARKFDSALYNKDQYDIIYPSHQDYYDKDKRLFVLDNHFYETEKYLLNGFQRAIQQGVNWQADLKHVDDYNKPQKSIDLKYAPKYHSEAVKSDLNYGEMARDNQQVLRAASDPYKEIFGSRN